MVQNVTPATIFDLPRVFGVRKVFQRYEIPKTPEMEQLDRDLSNKKIRLAKFCLSFEKSSIKVDKKFFRPQRFFSPLTFGGVKPDWSNPISGGEIIGLGPLKIGK